MDLSVKCRSMYDLKDYVFDFEKKQADYKNTDSIKRFDYLDIVILDLDPINLPWFKKSRDLQLLFNMCKMADKPLLATGGGMAHLVYYCATAGNNFRVINGKEKGGPVADIKNMFEDNPSKLEKIKENKLVYLDDLSGDYYVYDAETSTWKPEGNFGLHNIRAEASI